MIDQGVHIVYMKKLFLVKVSQVFGDTFILETHPYMYTIE